MKRLLLREVRLLLHDPASLFALVGGPLLCLAFLAYMLLAGVPKDMPVGLVDEDNTASTRELVRTLDAFQTTRIVRGYHTQTEARQAMQRGEIYAFYHIPRGTTRRANRQEAPHVSYYTNNAYLLAGSLTGRDLRTMSELASAAALRTQLRARGVPDHLMMGQLQPVVVDMHALGNPWLSYGIYLSNAFIPGLLCLFVLLLTAYSLGMEVKRGTVRAWLRLAAGSTLRALCAKLLPQTAVFTLVGWQGLAVLFYALLPSPRLAMSAASLVGVLSFSIAGISFPALAMHPVLQGVGWLFPLRHYFLLYVHAALHGYPLSSCLPHVLALCALALLPLLVAPRLGAVLRHVKYLP